MNRRAFLGTIGLAPVAAAAAVAVPAYASGGYVRGLRHHVGEMGTETIVPLKRKADIAQLGIKIDTTKVRADINVMVRDAIDQCVAGGMSEREAACSIAKSMAV